MLKSRLYVLELYDVTLVPYLTKHIYNSVLNYEASYEGDIFKYQ